jgi:hypothetical protein
MLRGVILEYCPESDQFSRIMERSGEIPAPKAAPHEQKSLLSEASRQDPVQDTLAEVIKTALARPKAKNSDLSNDRADHDFERISLPNGRVSPRGSWPRGPKAASKTCPQGKTPGVELLHNNEELADFGLEREDLVSEDHGCCPNCKKLLRYVSNSPTFISLCVELSTILTSNYNQLIIE